MARMIKRKTAIEEGEEERGEMTVTEAEGMIETEEVGGMKDQGEEDAAEAVVD